MGLPHPEFRLQNQSPAKISEAMFWFPGGMPSGRSLFLASSRLGKQFHERPKWFDALRTLTCRLDRSSRFLVTADGTTADRFLQRAAELFDLKVRRFQRVKQKVNFDWLINSLQQTDRAFVFQDSASKGSDDILLAESAAEVRVLFTKPRGNVYQAIEKRCLNDPELTFVLHEPTLTKSELCERLIDMGCQRWMVVNAQSELPIPDREFRIPRVSELPEGDFLIHCTRGRKGPWPDQPDAEFLDDLIFQSERSNHSPQAALERICATARLVGNNQITRSAQKVVCFTDVAWDDLKAIKKFRSHLGRWDFLPIGIALRKDALVAAGARPVIYGSDEVWDSLVEAEQPYFQVSKTETKSGNIIDWTQEKEWRIIGDLDLKQFKQGDIFAIDQLT